MNTNTTREHLLVDAHVHIYPVFDLGSFLDSAARNFDGAAARLGLRRGKWLGALVLTEASEDHAFDAIASGRLALPEGWAIAGAEETAVVLRTPDDRRLLLVAGQQAVTREGLEVLGIGITDRCPDRLTLAESIGWVRDRDAVAVVPWGFGKWTFARGRIIEKALYDGSPSDFAVGDNGGRLKFGPAPRLLRRAESLGYKVLPGTDPLPFPDQAARVGSAGFVLDEWEGTSRPGRELVERLRQMQHSPRRYATLTGLVDFTRLQVAMQLRKMTHL